MFQDIQQLHEWSGFSGKDNYHPTSKTGSHGDSWSSFDAGLHHLYPRGPMYGARAEPGTVHTQQSLALKPAEETKPVTTRTHYPIGF